MINSSRVQTNI